MTTVDNAMAICSRLETIYTEPMLDTSYTLYTAMVHMRDNGDVNGEPATKSNVLGLTTNAIEAQARCRCDFKLWVGIGLDLLPTLERFPGEVLDGGTPIGVNERTYTPRRTIAQQADMATLIQAPLMARIGEHLNVVDVIFCAAQDVFNQKPDLDLADSENCRDLYNTAGIIIYELIYQIGDTNSLPCIR